MLFVLVCVSCLFYICFMFLSFCFLVFTLDTLQKCVNDDTTNDNKNLNDYDEDDDGDYMI